MKRLWLGILLSISALCCMIAAGCNTMPPEEPWPRKLDTPKNLRVEDRVIIWDDVDHAQGYSFSMLGVDGETVVNYFDLSTLPYYAAFDFEIYAIGDGKVYLDSDHVIYSCQLIDPLTDFIFELTDDEAGYRVVLHEDMGYHEQYNIPDEYEGLPVKEIVRRGMPSYGGAVKSVRLPSALEKIGASTFAGFASLQQIEIPKNVASIGANTFYGCAALERVELPEGLESIGEKAFYNCDYLRAVHFLSTLQTVGVSAFQSCIRLVTVEFSSAVKIGSSAFEDCKSLMNLNLVKGVSIGTSAFRNCTRLYAIEFPEEVSISGSSFAGCTSLRTLDCAEGVRIASGGVFYPTFQNCTALTRADVSKCSFVGSGAFSGCTALTDITFPDDPSVYRPDAFLATGWYENQPDGYVIVNGDTLFHYKGEIPNGGVLDDFPAQIKRIGGWAFTNLNTFFTQGSNIVSIEIPDGVQLSGPQIFYNCESLQHVRLPNGLTAIPELTFYNCEALESIEIPTSVKVIQKSAFSSCTALQSVEIPEGVITIEEKAFWQCQALTEVSLPSTLEEIGSSVFYNCGLLTKLYFPDSIKKVEFQSLAQTVQEVILPVSMNNVTLFGTETTVYYRGSEERWKEDFPKVRGGIWYFYVENEADLPADGGNYWHFGADGKTPIVW